MRIRTRPDKIKAGRIKMLKLIPNIITVIRLLLIPVFIFCFFACEDKRIAFSIFVLAELSDLLDGYLARRLNGCSPRLSHYYWLSASGRCGYNGG